MPVNIVQLTTTLFVTFTHPMLHIYMSLYTSKLKNKDIQGEKITFNNRKHNA